MTNPPAASPTPPAAHSPSTPRSRRRLAFVSRGDYVAARVVLVVFTAALVVGCLIALWPAEAVHFRGAVVEEGPAYTAPGIIPTATARFGSDLEWTLLDPSIGQRVLVALPVVLILVAGLGIAWCLWQLIGAIQGGEPFTRASLRHARTLAVIVLGAAVVWPVLTALVQFILVTQVQASPSVLFTMQAQDFLPLLVGGLLVVLTEVFAKGLVLREDVDGLV